MRPAAAPQTATARTSRHRFPFWGSPSLRRTPSYCHGTHPGCESLPLLGKPFIEAAVFTSTSAAPSPSLPLLGKPFIEAWALPLGLPAGARDRFPFWGSPSLRHPSGLHIFQQGLGSLPLLGKPFIEARSPAGTTRPTGHRFPFWGSPSLRRTWHPRWCSTSRRIASPSGEALH